MLKGKLGGLFAFMLFAFAGLIAGICLLFFQNYTAQKNQFDQQVITSLNEVGSILAQNEKVNFLKGDAFFDSLINVDLKDKRQVIIHRNVDVDSVRFSNSTVESRIEIRMDSYSSKEHDRNSDSIEVKYELKNSNGDPEKFAELIQRAIGERKSLNGKLFNKDSIRETVGRSLKRNGINSEFTFGIVDTRKNHSVIGKEMPTAFSTSLYPTDILFPNRYELQVDIANSSKIIWSRMKGVIIMLTVFTIAILLCFLYAIHIIKKQKKLDQIKSDFINNMTHEFKTPLASIALASDSIMHKKVLGDEEKTHDLVEIIKKEKSKMMGHVERVLEIARLDEDEVKLHLTKFDISSLLVEVTNGLRPQLDAIDAQLILNLGGKCMVQADQGHLSNVIQNIIDNSIKYRNGLLKLDIELTKADGFIIIKVKDNGIGISNEAQKHVFQKFYREESGNVHNVKGFGLGLSYVKRIVDLHKGALILKSQKGIGTIIEIKLESYE